jgi:hypothetical protein
MAYRLNIRQVAFFAAAVFFLLNLSLIVRPVSSFSEETETVLAVQTTVPKDKYKLLEDRWGVRPVSIRLTASDYFVDFRYLVTDSEKSKAILSRSKENREAFLLAQKTGEKFQVPVTKMGALRSSTLSPKKGRQYTILFSNAGKFIKKGDKVSVVIGKFKVENLTVE